MSVGNDSTRKCNGCGDTKPLENFPLTRGKRFFRCRQCISQQSVEWQAANREKSNRAKLAYVERNPDRNRKAKLDYARSENGKRKTSKWKTENREVINARNRELFAARHEPLIGRLRRRKERERKADGVFTKQDEQAMLIAQCGKCAGCQSVLCGEYHVDHILPLVRGGSHWPENRQILCVTCNHRKGTKLPEEWAQIVDRSIEIQ